MLNGGLVCRHGLGQALDVGLQIVGDSRHALAPKGGMRESFKLGPSWELKLFHCADTLPASTNLNFESSPGTVHQVPLVLKVIPP